MLDLSSVKGLIEFLSRKTIDPEAAVYFETWSISETEKDEEGDPLVTYHEFIPDFFRYERQWCWRHKVWYPAVTIKGSPTIAIPEDNPLPENIEWRTPEELAAIRLPHLPRRRFRRRT